LEATLPNLQDGRRARFLFLPEGEDPDTLVRSEGTDAFRARINQHAQPLADYFFQQLSEEADPRSLEGKAHLVTLAAPLIDRIPGNHLRALMRQRLSEITGLSGEMLQQVAQSSPPERTTSLESVPPHEHYPDTPPDYADIADYAHHIEPPAEAYAPQKFWKKNSEWRQGGERKKTPPRKPVHVEAPTLTA